MIESLATELARRQQDARDFMRQGLQRRIDGGSLLLRQSAVRHKQGQFMR